MNSHFRLILMSLCLIMQLKSSCQQSNVRDSIAVKKWQKMARVNEASNPIFALVILDSILNYSKPINQSLYFLTLDKCLEICTMRHKFDAVEEYLRLWERNILFWELTSDSNYYLQHIMWKAYFELTISRRSDARKHFSQLISKLEAKKNISIQEGEILMSAYGNLSVMSEEEGDLYKSLYFHLRNIDVASNIVKVNSANLAISYLNSIKLFEAQGDTVSARFFFEKSQRLFESKNQPIQNILQFYLRSCDYYQDKKEYAKADSLIEKAQLLNAANDSWFLNQIKQRQANLFKNRKNTKKAIEILSELLTNIDRKKLNNQSIIAGLLIDYTKIQISIDSLNPALINIQDALNAASPSHSNPNFRTNPSVSDIFSKKELLEILNLKSDILLKLAQKQPDIYLNAAYETAQIGIQLMDSIRVDYTSDFDKTNLLATAYPIFEKFIQAAYLRHQPNDLQAAFQAVEQSKALLLLEGIKNVEAESVLSEKDRNLFFQLRSELTDLDKKRLELKDLTFGNPEYQKLQSQIFATNRQFDDLVKVFETRYPNYYQLKFDRQLMTVEKAQPLLQPQQTLLEYFVGDSSIFAFVVKPNTHQVIEIKKDFPLDNWVKILRGSMTDSFATQANVFTDMSLKLYEKLIKPLKSQLSEDVIIIPDGILGYIPFEALLTQRPEKATRFSRHAYLLREHNISYCFSATLLREMIQKKHRQNATNPLLAFAPFFEGDTTKLAKDFDDDQTMRRDFAPLSNSGAEAVGVAKLMGGEAIVGKTATQAQFIESAQTARILHLATHGKADDKVGDYAYLAFAKTKDSLENDLLYVRDLYNLTLNADMVVLSACETGIGKLQRGEGIISLARAFAYAGAKSIVTSLWSVNDSKTKDLMLLFYKNLRKGQSKSNALRAAKLSFIAKNDNPNAHPFYWAGFIGIGDMTKLK